MYPTLSFDDDVILEAISSKARKRQYEIGDVVVRTNKSLKMTY
jgi:hypothetical protein